MKKKKGQIRMSETIAVLFIFFVLVLFGIIFYYKYSQIAAKEKQEEILGMRAMDVTLKSLFLPELICGRGEAEPEDNCFEVMKLRGAAGEGGVLNQHFSDYYFDLFPYTKIVVEEIYPGNTIWVLYDKPKPDWERKEATYFMVALKDETKGEKEGIYSMGILAVEVYS